MDFLGAAHGWEIGGGGGGQKGPPPSYILSHRSTMMKLGTVITYLKKIQKRYESRGAPLEIYIAF